MKKLSFIVIPLMTMSFLTNCGAAKQFTVAFDTDGGSYVESQKVSSGEKAIKPNDPTKEQTDIYTFDFNEWQLDGTTYDFNTPVTKDITLKASYNKLTRHYKANAVNENNLIFTTLDNKTLKDIDIAAGQVFTFKVKADNATNSDHYIVPSILNISINEMEPLVDGYKVEHPGEEVSEVTIDANKVIGDIVISGNAVNDGEFNYQVSSCYGLEKIDSGSASKIDGLTLTFTPESSYTKPKAENIYIQFDDVPDTEDKKKWISPADADVSEEYCSYNEESSELIIKANHISNGIDIKVRANNFKLLEKLSWKKINELSFNGAAPYVFYIGEEKTVEINNKIHTVRIIGFNHDYSELPDDGTEPDPNKVLGITFEFKNVITNANGNAATTKWNNEPSNYDYRDSTLNKFLNNDILKMLPSSGDPDNPYLRDVIKTVDKKVGVYGNGSYTATSFDGNTHPYPYLFALAFDEMTTYDPRVPTGEGVRYQYYKNHKSKSDRAKKPVDSTNGANYWFRSPCINGSSPAWVVRNDGYIFSVNVSTNAFAVAPAFCI